MLWLKWQTTIIGASVISPVLPLAAAGAPFVDGALSVCVCTSPPPLRDGLILRDHEQRSGRFVLSASIRRIMLVSNIMIA